MLKLPYTAPDPYAVKLTAYRRAILFAAEDLLAGRDPHAVITALREMESRIFKTPTRDYPVRGDVDIF